VTASSAPRLVPVPVPLPYGSRILLPVLVLEADGTLNPVPAPVLSSGDRILPPVPTNGSLNHALGAGGTLNPANGNLTPTAGKRKTLHLLKGRVI